MYVFASSLIPQVKIAKPGTQQGFQIVHVRVWNDTVANLTLMALGSSTPEILLSIIEVFTNNFKAGELGPGEWRALLGFPGRVKSKVSVKLKNEKLYAEEMRFFALLSKAESKNPFRLESSSAAGVDMLYVAPPFRPAACIVYTLKEKARFL